jgi:hypothetical protein
MCKKIGIATLAVVAGLFILNSTHLGSYARTAWKKVKATAQRQVTPEFTLETIRNEIGRLDPEMTNYINTVARQEVELTNLTKEIKENKLTLEKAKDQIWVMNEAMEGGEKVVFLGALNSTPISQERLQSILNQKLTSTKRLQDNVKMQEKVLEAKEAALQSNKEKLMAMKDLKQKLILEADNLEAQLKALQVAETKSEFQLDDSKLSQIKSMLADVRTQIEVRQKEAELKGAFVNDTITVENKVKTEKQLSKEVREFLGENNVNARK